MYRIYVKFTIPDARAKSRQKYFQSLGLKSQIKSVRVVDCYTIDAKLNAEQLQKAKALLANPLMQTAEQNLPVTNNFDYLIEVGYLPGVTDNIGNTAKETLADGAKIKFKPGQSVYSSQVLFVHFNLNKKNSERSAEASAKADIFKIANSLYNPLIQKAAIKSFAEFKKDGGLGLPAPKVTLKGGGKTIKVDLNVSDEDLVKLGKLGIPEIVIARKQTTRLSVSHGVIPSTSDLSAEALAKVEGSLKQSNKRDSSSAALLRMTPIRKVVPNAALTVKRRGPLALGLEELTAIRDYFKAQNRRPTDVELETLAQTWSEHCKHTIFADPMDEVKEGIYKTYIKAATREVRKQKRGRDFCVSVFTDDAGGIIFDKDWVICHKVETHNTPSALDPFGGAVTGIVGVNRDVLGFGLGAKPIANVYGFCLADPEDKTEIFRSNPVEARRGVPKTDGMPGHAATQTEQTNESGKMLSARRITEGVISGINAGGNQSGIPTALGFLYFDPRFRGKPLVFAGTLGLIPQKINGRPGWEKKARAGDLIVTVGGRVGQDGIHGATFSSEGLDSHSPAGAVQIGDPITQKKFSDAIVNEARGQNLYRSITDCGAGGLSSAVGEMASQAGGCLVNLEKVPLKYPGLDPWQIWISESQERMVLAVPKNKWKKFAKLMQSRGVEATVIGQFTKSGNCVIKHKNKTVLDIDMEFLHNGRPKKQLISRSAPIYGLQPINRRATSLNNDFLKLLSRLNIVSTEFISRQYDHEVQGSSVLKPLQGRGRVNAQAAVIRPVPDSKKGAVLSFGYNPAYSEIDPYNMAACAIDAAISAAVAAGADPDYLALLDNFCWCSPEDPKRLWQLKQAARACYDAATGFGTPFISGKDSMHNDFHGFSANGDKLDISIPPTLLISAVGVIPDVAKTVSLDAKMPGDIIYILGETNNELGGSEYLRMLKQAGGEVPQVNAQSNHTLYRSTYLANQRNLIASAISVNRGGLAVALAKTNAGGGLGAQINLTNLPGDWKENYQALFSESHGRILVTVDPKKSVEFEKIMRGQTFAKIGTVTEMPELSVTDKTGRKIVNLTIATALKAYRSKFKNY